MQVNFRYRYLVGILDANVYVQKYEKCKFDPPILSSQAKTIFVGKSEEMTEFSGTSYKN